MTNFLDEDWREMEKVSVAEAEQVIENLTEEDVVGVQYDGPGSIDEYAEVTPEDAAELLNTAMTYNSELTPPERRRLNQEIDGFENLDNLYESSGEQGLETPVELIAGAIEGDEEASYAVRAEFNDGRVRMKNGETERLEGELTLYSNLLGRPTSPNEVKREARKHTGETGEAYQTMAELFKV